VVGELDELRDQLTMLKWISALSACSLVLSACGRPEATARTANSGGVVDSIFPVAEEIRRFEAVHQVEPVHELKQRAGSRDELVLRFVRALESSDTATLQGLSLDAGEFITLYFPHSAYARPPYRQNPAFVWFQFQQNGHKGIGRALARYGGLPSGFRGYHCAAEPVRQGPVTLWQNCVVTWRLQPDSIRLFGTILEHAGRFSFVSFANDL
jgi:hypothetical protein